MSSEASFRADERQLLEAIVAKRRPALNSVIREPMISSISLEVREELCDLLLDEFCETGRLGNDDPNARGLAIEELIDRTEPAQGVVIDAAGNRHGWRRWTTPRVELLERPPLSLTAMCCRTR